MSRWTGVRTSWIGSPDPGPYRAILDLVARTPLGVSLADVVVEPSRPLPEEASLSAALEQFRAARLRRERRVHVVAFGFVVVLAAISVFFVLLMVAAKGSPAVSIERSNPVSDEEAGGSPSAPAHDRSVERTLHDATGKAARLLATTEDTEVARSALVGAQDVTGCAPEEGGPALVHVGNAAEKAAERASRADFYATAKDNGREYATLAHAYADRRTIVYVAVAWECT